MHLASNTILPQHNSIATCNKRDIQPLLCSPLSEFDNGLFLNPAVIPDMLCKSFASDDIHDSTLLLSSTTISFTMNVYFLSRYITLQYYAYTWCNLLQSNLMDTLIMAISLYNLISSFMHNRSVSLYIINIWYACHMMCVYGQATKGDALCDGIVTVVMVIYSQI